MPSRGLADAQRLQLFHLLRIRKHWERTGTGAGLARGGAGASLLIGLCSLRLYSKMWTGLSARGQEAASRLLIAPIAREMNNITVCMANLPW